MYTPDRITLTHVASLFACCTLACFSGCGSDRPDTVKVTGKVTFNGQPPPSEGAINFAMQTAAEGYPLRSGRADFNTTGSYSATSFDKGDGLIPGSYVVRVECWKEAPTMDGKPGISHVPKGFEKELEVKPDSGSISFDIDVTEE
jgi:hypothetical protein